MKFTSLHAWLWSSEVSLNARAVNFRRHVHVRDVLVAWRGFGTSFLTLNTGLLDIPCTSFFFF